ncbi:hypothetical protein KHQ82_01985 [Mycoplasmatota bacterium]|nr:hypothetical protein KHQ82_01985 [Mycoplasmatota bacterium]
MRDDGKKNNQDEQDETKKKIITRKIVINLSSNYSNNQYINYFIKLLINIGLFISILFYTNIAYYDSVYSIVLFAAWFSIFENILSQITAAKFTKYILMSFGSLFIFPILISMGLGFLMVEGLIEFKTTETLIGFTIVFMIVRKVITVLLLNAIHRYRFNKMFRKKEGK